MHSNYILLYV